MPPHGVCCLHYRTLKPTGMSHAIHTGLRGPFSRFLQKSICICLGAAVLLAMPACRHRHEMSDTAYIASDSIPPTGECPRMYGICIQDLDVEQDQVKPGESMSAILSRYGLPAAEIHALAEQSAGIFDVRRLRAGQTYTAMRAQDSTARLQYWVYERDLTHFIVYAFTADSLTVTEEQKDVSLQRRRIAAPIGSSLWLTVVRQGFNPVLSDALSELYAWQVDFFGIAAGDSICAVFDEIVLDSTSVGIGQIYGACFRHAGKDYYAIPFTGGDSIRRFFDENGQSLRKAFLKAPLKYSRISSTFSNSRYHPVLKVYRAHHGVDYAAPTGTPVQSIGDGVVTKRAYQRNGAGNYVTIKHNATYTTSYMHLSRFGSGIAVGARVVQGQVIGYVGSTGLATGPHLDFRVYRNGTPVNPLSMESPPVEPVPDSCLVAFQAVRDSVLQMLQTVPDL